ncbi:Transcriptional regulator [Hyella patelloides LEGE 07179]|uniref:Transcriptional regulator n=1 Tax=Hyella patelloides LEGE 07179 TaxID=945734 RepID=A0A563VMK7_9CYAN|nr:GntR family transcriptional regulator [Hyella patelloides]VEP12597.1 Transcriptional regulator [Hyella patelloides LEGE 07179]
MAKLPKKAKKPLHLIISEKLRTEIETGVYSPGALLPSEFDLGALFGVSRTTVRKVIANLINQGLVYTQQGKGVFVKQQQKISFSLSNPLTFLDEELSRQGLTGEIRNLSFQLVKASPEVCTQLKLSQPKIEVYQQQKIILAEQLPIALEIAYFPLDIGENLGELLQKGFTYATLQESGYHLVSTDIVIESAHATSEVAEYLQGSLGTPILIYRYVTYDHHERPLVCGETLSLADRTYYSVSLKSRGLHNSIDD